MIKESDIRTLGLTSNHKNLFNPEEQMDKIIQIDIKHEGTVETGYKTNLFDFVSQLPVNKICADLPAKAIHRFNTLLPEERKSVLLSYNHSPLIVHEFLREIHKTDQIFQPVLFCRKNYFKQHKSWGFPIFHFSDATPEIYTLSPGRKNIQMLLASPEDIAAIYIIKDNLGSIRAKNIIARLERTDGSIHFKLKSNAIHSIVVFRKLYLYFDHGLKYFINIHDDFLLSRHAQEFPAYYDMKNFDEARLDADNFFARDGFISFTPEITRNYHYISSNRFLADMAIHIYRYPNQMGPITPKQTVLYNRYINGNLLAKLNYIHPEIKFSASIDNNFMLRNIATSRTLFKISEDRFEFETGYNTQVLCNLHRIKSHLSKNGKKGLMVQCGHLFDMNRTFAEKKSLIDQLILYGVTEFNFIISLNNQSGPFINEFIFNDHERIALYKHWLTYVKRMAGIWATGVHYGGGLALFPTWDTHTDSFYKTVKALRQLAIPIQLIDQDGLNKHNIRMTHDGKIVSKSGQFDYLLLPAIHGLSDESMALIDQVIAGGGIVIALGQIPKAPIDSNLQQNFDFFIEKYWFKNPGTSAISFKEHDSGGKSYQIMDPMNLPGLLDIIPSSCPVKFNGSFLRANCKMNNEHFVFFLINQDPKQMASIPIIGNHSFIFEKYNWETNRFEPLEIYGDKQSGYRLNHTLPAYSSVIIRSLLREKPPIRTKSKSKEHIIHITSNDWFVEDGTNTETARLADRSIIKPYAWQPLVYSKLFSIPKDLRKGERVFIDFGTVKSWARLAINDKDLGFKLFPPFKWEITKMLKPGKNGISLKVGHQLSNYFALEDENRGHVSPVKPYGLIGPVSLLVQRTRNR